MKEGGFKEGTQKDTIRRQRINGSSSKQKEGEKRKQFCSSPFINKQELEVGTYSRRERERGRQQLKGISRAQSQEIISSVTRTAK